MKTRLVSVLTLAVLLASFLAKAKWFLGFHEGI
jgi:hypothetical protein